MSNPFRYCAIVIAMGLSACTTMPSGPSVMVLPGSNKNFDQFRYDDRYCRQYALGQLGGETPQQSGLSSGVGSAVVGAGLGAATGAAFGGGTGAAIGSGAGLAAGSVAGTSASHLSYYEAQEYFDHGYIQCMYALGHRVPVSGKFSDESQGGSSRNPSLPPPPPPPAGNPPPPPPR